MLVYIDEKDPKEINLDVFGYGSLCGSILNETVCKGFSYPKKVKLVFPQTSLGRRKRNGGPNSLIITEFVIPFLLSDILVLVNQGVEVIVDMPEIIESQSIKI